MANRRPIPYYFSLALMQVSAKSWPGTFYPNLVLEPVLSSEMPNGSGTWLAPLMPSIGKHDWSEFKVANRKPIPYYFSLRLMWFDAKSWPGAFYANLVLEPVLSSEMPHGSGTWLAPWYLPLVNMIDQNSRWTIGGPFLPTFHCVWCVLMPNPDQELFIQTWFWNL